MKAIQATHFMLLALALSASAGQLRLLNGDQISGELVQIEAGRVRWRSPVLGELKVPKAQILTLESDTSLDLDSESADSFTNCRVRVAHDRAFVNCNDEEMQQLSLPALTAQPPKPPWHLGGRIHLKLEKDDGNVNKKDNEGHVQLFLDHGLFVHELSFETENETSSGRLREEEYELDYQLDRFFNPAGLGWYAYSRMEWDKDRFRVPEEWVALGLGLGYQWSSSAASRLRIQIGIDHWELDGFDDGRKRSANGGRWVLDYRYLFSSLGDLTLFHNQEGIWEIGEPDNLFLEAKLGMRLPILDGLYIELSIDYENTNTSDELDVEPDNTEWSLGVGYTW
ncbi:MAG: DUF481 domain-containing protein [Pseudomonadales bacterium]